MVTFQLFNEKSKYTLFEFEFLQTLGSGSFANVKLVKEKKTGNLFALKMVRIHNNSKTTNAEIYNIKCEIFIHRKLNHPNIIKFHDYIQYDSGVYLVLDYTENGNLYTYLHRKKYLAEKEIFRFFYQTCQAVQYLHQNDVLHRDIKPENLLLDKDLNIKLCDFGWATQRIQDKRLTFCGTYEYMAPEIAYKRPYDYRVDIWSLGVLLYELIHSEPPFRGRSLPEIYKSFTKGLVKWNSKCHPEAKDLIQKILKQNPNDRLSLSQILSHPWVTSNLSKEENLDIPQSLPLKVLLHSTSLPPEATADVSARHSKEYCEPKTATNIQSKPPQYDTWSEYLKGKQGDLYHDSSDTAKTYDKNNKTAPELRDETLHRILNPSNSHKDLNSVPTKPIENAFMMTEQNPFFMTESEKVEKVEKVRSHSPASANVILNSHTTNVVRTPEKGAGNKNKVFENNIFSPSFKSKLTMAIRQLSAQTPTSQGNKHVNPTSNSKNVLQQINQNAPVNQNEQVSFPFSRAFSIQEEKENFMKKYMDTHEDYGHMTNLPLTSFSQNPHQSRPDVQASNTVEYIKPNFTDHNYFHTGEYHTGEEHPVMPSSTATTRTNTLDLSHGNEVRSPFERSSKDAMEQHRQIPESGKENIKNSPESSGHYRQISNTDLGRYLQVSNSKKALQLKGILGANVVRYHIPISQPSHGQSKNKENFLGNLEK